GKELYQVGDFSAWEEVARWLGRLHAEVAAAAPHLAAEAHLIAHGANYYRNWMRRALAIQGVSAEATDIAGRSRLEKLAARYEEVLARLAALPRTFIHGEFYASNVLVQETATGLRVCPVDWEMAALRPGLIDLAALTAGKWTPDQQEALALAYHAALKP